jgi:drug/metabolite transporter (DMT)-like permease
VSGQTVEAGVLLGLTSAALWGGSSIFAALLGGRLDSWRLLGSWQWSSLPVVVLVAVAFPIVTTGPLVLVLAGVAGGILATIAYLTFFVGLRLGPVSVVSPIIAANGGLGAILAVIVLGEPLSLGQAVGAALATVGVLLVGVRFDRDWQRTRLVGPGVLFATVSMVAFAVQTIVLSVPSHELGWPTAFVVSRLTGAIAILGAIAVLGRWLGTSVSGGGWRSLSPRLRTYVLLGGLASVFGFLAFAMGLDYSYAWVIGVTSAFAPILVVTAGRVIFDERLSAVQWGGVALVFGSIVLVAVA